MNEPKPQVVHVRVAKNEPKPQVVHVQVAKNELKPQVVHVQVAKNEPKRRLVKFGTGAFERVGVVIGEYEHTWMGRVLMVRTPANILKDQQFDNVPVDKARPATLDEFLAGVERAKVEAAAQLESFAESVAESFAESVAESPAGWPASA